jgi:CubicO group peptidase (beta-lactamase class C family)
MYKKRTKITLIILLLCFSATFIAYLAFEPELYALEWKPLPEIKDDIGESETYLTQYASAIEKANLKVLQGRKKLGVPGISIAVGVNGKKVWAAGYGYADLSTQRPMSLVSKFRIGSTSKALTSLLLGELIESNAVDLDMPITHYLPHLPQSMNKITSRQLASHSAGIRNYDICWCLPISEYFNNNSFDSVSDALDTFIYDPLLFEPGSQFSYSSYNYTLLSAVLEKVGVNSFVELMQQRVFKPFNMPNTGAENDFQSTQEMVSFYNIGYGHFQESFPVDTSNKLAGGGFVSTPSDLVNMGNLLLSNKQLKPSTLQQLFEPQKLTTGEINSQQYALGWRRSETNKDFANKGPMTFVHHGGVATGNSSLLILFPEQQFVISVLINGNIVNFGDLWNATFDIAEEFIKD